MTNLSTRPVNILVCHSQPLLAIGLVAILQRESGFKVFVLGVDLPAAMTPGVDVIVADHDGVAGLLANARSSHAVLSAARILLVGYDAEDGRLPVPFQDQLGGYTLPGCQIDHLLDKVRMLASESPHHDATAT